MEVRCESENSALAYRAVGRGLLLLLAFMLPSAGSYAQSMTNGSVTTKWKHYGPFLPVAEASISNQQGSGRFPFLMQTVDSGQNQPNPHEKGSQKNRKYSPSATTGSPGHMYWVVPAFKVNYSGHFQPLSPKEKFSEWAEGVYDPLGLGVTAFEAGTLEYSSTDGFCGYGHGWGPYGQCYGSLELDATVSSFIGDYALAVWWHQDPRYFRLGKGSFGKRVLYAISRVFITYNDKGDNVFYSSALSGTAIASAISNLYYPPQDRGVSNSISRAGLDLGNTAIYNAAAEFWPDIHRGLQHMF
jgi:hypothetical protein